MTTSTLTQKLARQFAEKWAGKGYEKGDTQRFWLELLQTVLGVSNPYDFIEFEDKVLVENTNFMDGYIPATKVLIEQKSIEKELGKPVVQSDGSLLNPFQQAKKYIVGLPLSKHPRWVVTCNFREFWVYDMEQPNGEPQKILLANLGEEYYRLQFLVDEGNEHLKREMEVSVKAGELVGVIYDKLLEQYGEAGVNSGERFLSFVDSADSPSGTTTAGKTPAHQADILRSLNILCVRLVFCLYAEDAGLFPTRTYFHDYLASFPANRIRKALIDLFEVLDTPLDERDPYLDEDLAAFPYVNGGLFGKIGNGELSGLSEGNNSPNSLNSQFKLIIPQFNDDLKNLLLEKASADFDWSEISPTIFGAVFESTLNPETRRSGGMHYTSIENIHKVIDPLFLNELRAEFESILGAQANSPAPLAGRGSGGGEKIHPQLAGRGQGAGKPISNSQRQALAAFQNKLASLTFFDPACGSGNFLTETFLSLRRLENEVIQAMYGGANILTFDTLIKVNISQFYGIEINDFACTVAKTALWIAEHQMMQQTSMIAGKPIDFLPLKTNAYIHEGNALRTDWAGLFGVSKEKTITISEGAKETKDEASSDSLHSLTTINGELSKLSEGDNSPNSSNSLHSLTNTNGELSKLSEDNNSPNSSNSLHSLTNTNGELSGLSEGNNSPNSSDSPTSHFPDYIIGNPPFVGASMMTAEQKKEATSIFGKIKLSNSIDYVGAWYHKAAELMQQAQSQKHIKAALVSTNSITQGEQVAALWQPLMQRYGLQIDFAYRTFRWDSEADIKAHVHCVIIGFSIDLNRSFRDDTNQLPRPACGEGVRGRGSEITLDYRDTIGIPKGYYKTIFLSDNQNIIAKNINPYLIDAPDVMVESRAKPLCNVQAMVYGNKPTDGGNFILSEEEKAEVIKKAPQLEKYIHPYIGAVEFINNKVRYCFWLQGISPLEIKQSPILYERVQNVKQLREASTSSATRQKAVVPNEFFFISQPTTHYLIIPRVSSENRRYIPIGFMTPDIIASDACSIIPNATLYHFGVLTSNVHMAWMRCVAGRLKSDYRYSGSVVYNNFPWCEPTPEQKNKIERTAQDILDVRAKYKDCSLAVLYDEVTMPPELRRAHQENDKAVMQAYGFKIGMTESDCVAELFKMYQELTK